MAKLIALICVEKNFEDEVLESLKNLGLIKHYKVEDIYDIVAILEVKAEDMDNTRKTIQGLDHIHTPITM